MLKRALGQACRGGGAVPRHALGRIPVQTQNAIAGVLCRGDWQLQTPAWHVTLPAACAKLF